MNYTCFVREPILELVDHIYLRFNTHIRSCSYLRLQSLGLKDFKFKNKVTEREREKNTGASKLQFVYQCGGFCDGMYVAIAYMHIAYKSTPT